MGNILFHSDSSPGKILLVYKFRQRRKEPSHLLLAHNTTATTFPQGENLQRTEGCIYSLLGSYPCSFNSIYHFCGETYFEKYCGNSLKATVPELYTAIGGHPWSVDSEG